MSIRVATLPLAAWTSQLAVPFRLAINLGAFAFAFDVRLYHVQDPPLNFQATRHYRSLVLAREYYFEEIDSTPAWSGARLGQPDLTREAAVAAEIGDRVQHSTHTLFLAAARPIASGSG